MNHLPFIFQTLGRPKPGPDEWTGGPAVPGSHSFCQVCFSRHALPSQAPLAAGAHTLEFILPLGFGNVWQSPNGVGHRDQNVSSFLGSLKVAITGDLVSLDPCRCKGVPRHRKSPLAFSLLHMCFAASTALMWVGIGGGPCPSGTVLVPSGPVHLSHPACLPGNWVAGVLAWVLCEQKSRIGTSKW